ncbi:hypothetical protein [Insolitispirillum peregrinum]|uniref:hypothetical protein n=1 Tax=Insolitispirillum peregrinum TaxID=80876 RepID=UPI0015882BF0|nr:hypothetical protein [Insolitispirillum peregrinum]
MKTSKGYFAPLLPGLAACLLLSTNLINTPATAAGQCFCLQHPDSGSIVYYGCDAQPIPGQNREDVACRIDPLHSNERASIEKPDTFTRLAEGKLSCNPCDPLPTGGEDNDIPRGLQKP